MGLYLQTQDAIVWLYGFIAVVSMYLTYIVVENAGTIFEKGSLEEIHKELFITKLARKIRLKPHFLSLSVDIQMFVISVGAILNQLLFVLWFFMIVQNLYWIIVAMLVVARKWK